MYSSYGSSVVTVRPCYLQQDHGLASLTNMDLANYRANNFVTNSMTNFTNLYVSSPRSGRFYDPRFEDQQPHFLEACSLCNKPLGDNKDIFMYRSAFFFFILRILFFRRLF